MKSRDNLIKTNNFPAIDILKGIGIILVVIGHNSSGVLRNFIYTFHMPLFFIISGFLFSKKNIKDYLMNSFQRLLIPYFLFLILLSLPLIISTCITNKYELGGYFLI